MKPEHLCQTLFRYYFQDLNQKIKPALETIIYKHYVLPPKPLFETIFESELVKQINFHGLYGSKNS